jgi:hypothetical protein
MRVAAIKLKSGHTILKSKTSFLSNRNFSRGDLKKIKYVGVGLAIV